MRIDPLQVAAKIPETSPPKSRERVAANPRPAEPPRPSAQTQLSAPQSPKYEVTVRYAENQVLVTKFIDQNSGEIVQQIPPEQVLRIIESIQELLKEAAQSRVLDTFR